MTFRGHAFYIKRVAAFSAQEVQPLARNAVTQYTPDIQVSGVFRLTERTYGDCPYRSVPLFLFDKLEFGLYYNMRLKSHSLSGLNRAKMRSRLDGRKAHLRPRPFLSQFMLGKPSLLLIAY